MEKFEFYGYEFKNKDDLNMAKNDIEKIKCLQNKIKKDNPEFVLKLYNQLSKENSFQTQIGIEYMRTIQKELIANPQIANSEIANIRLFKDESTRTEEKKYEKRNLLKEKLYENQAKHNKEMFYKSVIINIVFLIVIISMFVIAKKADKFDVSSYKESIENKYISWENELNERESSLNENEIEGK